MTLVNIYRFARAFIFAISFLALSACSRVNQHSTNSENTIQKTLLWFTTGKVDPNILANNFLFRSPYYKGENKIDFVNEFNNKNFYQKNVLAKIKKFDPLITLRSADGKYFAIITEYHTYSGHQVYDGHPWKIK